MRGSSNGQDRCFLLGKMSFINEQTCRQAVAWDAARSQHCSSITSCGAGLDKEGSRGQGQGQEWLFGKFQGDRASGGQMLGMVKAMMSAQAGLFSDRFNC